MPSHPVINTISLTFASVPWWIVISIAVASVAAAVWYYRDTIPPVSGPLRIILSVIRALGLFLIVIGIAEPILRVTMTVPHTSVTAVLIDTSSSMDSDTDPVQSADARQTLDSLREHLPGQVTVIAFDSSVRTFDDSQPTFEGTGTNISTALEMVSHQPDVTAAVLISDGGWNLGEDPAVVARSLPLPVHTVITGSSDVPVDIVLSDISVSPVGRDGTDLPVEVMVSSSVASDQPVPVTIFEDGVAVRSGQIEFSGTTSARIQFEVPLDGIGIHRFSAVIDPDDDINHANNTREFSVNALKNRFTILIAASEPSPDLAFLRRVIDSDSTFILDIAVGNGVRDGFLESIPADVSGYDGIIIIDGGGSLLTPEAAAQIRTRIDQGCGLWVLGSAPLAPGGAVLEQTLPFRRAGNDVRSDLLYSIDPTETGHSHFVTAESADTDGAWSNLPPLTSVLPIQTEGHGGIVLAEAIPTENSTSHLPAIIAGTIGTGKVLMMPLSGIWRWSLTMTGANRDDGFYGRFVTGALSWLTADTDTAPLTVSTGTQSYLSGQAIQFEARLFDNIYVPVSGAEITLEIDRNPSTRTILEESAPAVYTVSRQGIGPGEHSFDAIAYLDRKEIATTSGTFTVQDFSLEMLTAASDPQIMASIAALSGGIAVTPASIDSIITHIFPETSAKRRIDEHHPALNPFIPFAALSLLILEWAIRKRRGML